MRNVLRSPKTKGLQHKRLLSIALQFAVLFAFWLILSGIFQIKYILIGAFSAGLVTFLTNDLLYDTLRYGEPVKPGIYSVFVQILRFVAYLPWLLSRIIMANVQVAYLVLHPKMPIDPAFLIFQTKMRKGMAQVTLANSITLTPGTITVSLEKGRYIVHALKPSLAQELVDAVMQNKVTAIYGEEKERPPVTTWAHSLEELKP